MSMDLSGQGSRILDGGKSVRDDILIRVSLSSGLLWIMSLERRPVWAKGRIGLMIRS